MLILRGLGVLLLFVAVGALAYDGARSLASGGGILFTSLGEHWYGINPASLNIAQAAIQRHVHPYLWDPIIVTLLLLPTWFIAGVLGALLYLAGSRRKRYTPTD